MRQSNSRPRLAFVVQLDSPQSRATDISRVKHVTHLFGGHGIACTWIVPGCCSLELLTNKGLLDQCTEIALDLSQVSPSSATFARADLRKRLTAIQRCMDQPLRVVAGSPPRLRRDGAVLAEQGIRGIVNCQQVTKAGGPAPLPFGLWNLGVGAELPQRGWVARWLQGTRHILKSVAHRGTLLVAVRGDQFAQASPRDMQQLEKLLQLVSHAARRGELSVVTAGQILETLVTNRQARPQQSILRAA